AGWSFDTRRARFRPFAQIDQIRRMCLVHDIGKIGIGEIILNKNGELADNEWAAIREHPVIGHRIIEPLNLNFEERSIVRHHHERFDGKGYPDGLSGETIPIQVRIVSLCDTFDAMTSNRPYRKALSSGEALFRLRSAANTQLDPYLVSVFGELVREARFQDILGPKKSVLAA
ncbi:MAG: HD domain-containing protein, partial [Deltaproteobacteria bacterium]|nr:HD domain-containing protein [Deltaproteobacteria bacterium]